MIYIAAGIAIIVILIILFNFLFRKIMNKRDSLPIRFTHHMCNFVIIVIGVYIIGNGFEVTKDVSQNLLHNGALLVAILTFAAQQTLGNIISGFSVSVSKPLDIGDKVKLMQDGTIIAEGIVKGMTVRHVVIEQFDGQSCIVPNSMVDKCVIVNTNFVEHVGNFMEIEVAMDTDIEKAKSVIRQLCSEE